MEVVIGPYRAIQRRYDGQLVPRIGLWQGEDLRTGDEVSLTVLTPAVLETARNELEVADAVHHAHLLTVIDVVEHDADDQAAIVAPWPVGGLLAEVIAQRGRLSVAEMLTVVIPLADALAALHRANLRHGGVCPEDIWFDNVGRPFLGPVAVSRAVVAQNRGFPPGSRDLAPEVVRGDAVRQGPITVAADVFSLGSVALACLIGRSAWPADSPADVLVQSAAGLWPDLPDDAGPPGVVSLVREMLANAPDRRPTAGDVADRLSRLGVPQPVQLARQPADITDGPNPVPPRHLSPVSPSVPGEVGFDDSGGPDGGDDASRSEEKTPQPPGRTLPVVAFSPEAARPREQRASSPTPDATVTTATAPADAPGMASRVAARIRRPRRPPSAQAGRGSGLPSGEPGPGRTQADLRELMRLGLANDGMTGGSGHPPGSGPGRLTPLARTGLILLAGVLVTLVALQVSMWWDDGSDATAVDAGSGSSSAPASSTDWAAVVGDLDAARGRALAAADPELLTAVYSEGTPELQADTRTIAQLADRGLRVVDGVHQIVSVTVVGSPSPPRTFVTDEPGPTVTVSGSVTAAAVPGAPETVAVRLAVVDTLPAYPIVDAAGQQVGTTQARAEQRRVLVLANTEQGFRIAGVEPG